MTTPFEFLRAEFPELHREAVQAGQNALPDPRTACFYARRVVEQALRWVFDHDRSLARPYDNKLSALLHAPAFQSLMGDQVFRQATEIVRIGNRAVHDKHAPSQHDSVAVVSHLFEFCYWFARTYARKEKPAPDLRFDPATLPPRQPVPARTRDQIQELEANLEEERQARQQAQEELRDRAELEAELAMLREEIARAKAQAVELPDEHDYSEAATRDWFIDRLLAEAGWALEQPRDREFPVDGMPDGKPGYVDYVLWGDDGLPLAVVEAKRTRRDARAGQQQAKLYADCLEAAYGRRPIVFYTNGYEHWLWDEAFHPPRRVSGFYKKDELEWLIQRRTTRRTPGATEIDAAIADRYYQTRAVRKIAESFEKDAARKALLVMATGAGKTRTVIALSDVLIRAGWVKRVLFLADRRPLVKQAVNAFKVHLPDSSPVNLVEDRHGDGRVLVSTYPTMLNLINQPVEGERRFGPGHFDLVVIDEAHRSVFQKYRAIFAHFDALLVGLTATPRDEVDRNTYELFGLEPGVPTDAYDLDDAVRDGFLVPFKGVSVPLRFVREGIRYNGLSVEEQARWEELWDEEDEPPDAVGAEALNRWLFNADTVDKVLQHLMTRGLKVAGGDRLGKTIVFAKNREHAKFIVERFDASYPHLRGEFARIITAEIEHAQDLIEKFGIPDGDPHIAVSVDMLDTGIDVPEVVNLVFFKPVRSRTKFWQMIGRGTRLRSDLLGPGKDKRFFYVFDYCQNLEFFNQHPEASEGSLTPSLGARLFRQRLELLAALDAVGTYPEQRRSIADALRSEVEAMSLDNVVVRPHRRLVERFGKAEAWEQVDVGDLSELARNVAGLPAQVDPEPEEVKRFDQLLLTLELALLRTDAGYEALQQKVRDLSDLLDDLPDTIPAVVAERALIHEVQGEEWWQDVTLPMIEDARSRLRSLMPFIQRGKRKTLYTDFEDELGHEAEVVFQGISSAATFERFRRKALAFLAEHHGIEAVDKLRNDQPVTVEDLAELERILVESGIGTSDDVDRAEEEAGGLGLFIRGLVGLDRSAAKAAFAEFLDSSRYTANQIEFVNLVIDELTANGVIEPRRFYESPFTDLSPHGPDAIFEPEDVASLLRVVRDVRSRADAA